MALKKLRCFNSGSIAAGASWEKQFAPNEDWNIKYILFSDRGNQPLTDVLTYIKLGEDLVTDDYSPASIFGSDKLTALDIDKTIPTGTPVYIKVTNNKTAAIDIDVCFVLEE